LGAIVNRDVRSMKRKRKKSCSQKTLTDALEDEGDNSLTVAIYRYRDSQRYAARGSIDSTSSHHLTRGQRI